MVAGHLRLSHIRLTGVDCVVNGSLAVAPGGRLTADLTTEKARLEQLRELLGSIRLLRRYPAVRDLLARIDALPRPLTGLVTAQVQLSGTQKNPRARLAFDGTDLVVGKQQMPQLAAVLELAGGVVSLHHLDARANGGSLTANGTLDLDGPLDLTVSGTDFALAAFQPWIGAGRELNGHLDLSARVTGTARSPRATAQAAIRDATIAGFHFDEITADSLRLLDDRIDLGRVAVTQAAATADTACRCRFPGCRQQGGSIHPAGAVGILSNTLIRLPSAAGAGSVACTGYCRFAAIYAYRPSY